MNRRDLLLNEMHITQWILTKPQVLKGDAQVRLAEQIKLIVVCDENHQSSRLFQDLLFALGLNSAQCQWLNSEQSLRLQLTDMPLCLVLQAVPFWQEFAKKYPKLTAWQFESWQALADPVNKRQLWQQIQPFCHPIEAVV